MLRLGADERRAADRTGPGFAWRTMADPRPGVGRPRMTVAEEPEYVYGTRKRKNGLPHEQWVYLKIWTLTQQGENALTISQHNGGDLGMTADEVAYVVKKQRERGKPFPKPR